MNATVSQPVALIERSGMSPLHIMMHGLQGSKELFSTLLNEDFFSGRAVVAPDFPGFGDSLAGSNRSVTVSAYTAFVEELAISRGYRDVTLIGHSLGGMVATKLLNSTSLRVHALVSLEGNLTLEDCGSSREISALTEGEFRGRFLPNLKAQLEGSPERSAPFRLGALRRADPTTLYEIARSIVEESRTGDLLRTLEESKVPRLLLIGDRSSFSSRKVRGGVNVVIAPGAGHFVLHDNYDFVLAQVVDFLKRNEGR
jgi:pimeloyl-ACP methyl ester carboxylesterase